MDFGFSEEQGSAAPIGRRFLRNECPMSYVRQMMEDERGYADEVWNKMAELGWMGLIVPEAYGGAGLSIVDLVVVLEEMGKVVLPGPFFSTVAPGRAVCAGRRERSAEKGPAARYGVRADHADPGLPRRKRPLG